jgi:hypothetical protein
MKKSTGAWHFRPWAFFMLGQIFHIVKKPGRASQNNRAA